MDLEIKFKKTFPCRAVVVVQVQVVCPKSIVVVTATVAGVVKSSHFNFQQLYLQTYIQKINVNKNM